ncbi:MAG: UDP-N-acetylmuramoyl-L-alanine--D-glutamate ligase [Candidatus Latescibacterota bacterium]|nr:UDP-N-acetylmuramoyl-L-alanine--D-glutamate ligase [Candidatus Latescibacterota bacterium]
MDIEEFKHKKIALLGFGVENRAVANYFDQNQISYTVFDSDPDISLNNCHLMLQSHLGPNYLEALPEFELIFRTPGFSPIHQAIQKAKNSGALVTSQTQLFFDLCPGKLIGITGTKGKGTTTKILECLLQHTTDKSVFVGGNIGIPPVSFLGQLKKDDSVILELSSFQLQDLNRSPHLAVLLAVGVDHLNYHADENEYVEAKTNIVRKQTDDDFLIVNEDCITAKKIAQKSKAQILRFSLEKKIEGFGVWLEKNEVYVRGHNDCIEKICTTEALRLKGRHNWQNACAAIASSLALNCAPDAIGNAIGQFTGLPHRLEQIDVDSKFNYYNDSLATTPDATIAAINAFEEPVVLIAGGASKGGDFLTLAHTCAHRSLRAAILIGEESDKISKALEDSGYVGPILRAGTDFAQAVEMAHQHAQPGDTILLSPACASFDMFNSYAERGEIFKDLCRQGS